MEGEIEARGKEMRKAGMMLIRDPNFLEHFADADADFNFSGDEYNVLFTRGESRFYPTHFVTGLENKHDTRTSVAADLDHDGDLDLVERVLQPNVLDYFENKLADGRGFLELELRQPGMNPQAIGARVMVECGGLRQTRQVSAGDSFLAQSPYRLFVGLGSCKGPVGLVVTWPDGEQQRLETARHKGRARLIRGTEAGLEWLP